MPEPSFSAPTDALPLETRNLKLLPLTAHLLFLLSLSNWISGVNPDRKRSYIGIGAFNLVRASAYRECGGYEALRLTVVDDAKLGLLLSRSGHRTRAFLGGDDVECDWGATAWGTVGIMEKNYFAAVDYRTGVVLAATLFVLLVLATLIFGLVSGTAAGLAAALSPLTLILPSALLARRLGWPWFSAIYVPFMIPLFMYSVLNSTWATLREGGIRWRETFYPPGNAAGRKRAMNPAASFEGSRVPADFVVTPSPDGCGGVTPLFAAGRSG